MYIYAILLTLLFNTLSADGAMQKNPVVTLQTTAGTIEITLRPDVAPKACENFIRLGQTGYYNNVIFHRVIKSFMVQCGDPTGTGRGGQSIWGTTFEDETSPQVKFDKPGLLAMANRGPATNGSQFFITTVPTPWLNGKHTIFGEVTAGYDVVQKIENSPVGAMDKPVEDIKILSVTVKNVSEAPNPALISK